jgi:hypothetical protein
MRDYRASLQRLAHVGFTAVAYFTLTGCGSHSGLGSVHGVVRLDGKPLTTGTVRFVPTAGRAASGKIESDGSFVLGTYGKSDGALIGTHRVAIIAYESPASAGGRPDTSKASPGTTKALVPRRYMAPGTSRLTFDVKPGDNQAEFDLTTSP